MNRIKYIGVYDQASSRNDKDISIACVKKMDYVIQTINSLGIGCDVISIARTKDKCQHLKETEIGKNRIIIGPAIGSKNKLISRIGELQIRIWLFLYLLFCVSREDTILVYHSPRYMSIINLCSKIKRMKYILEVEELYYKFSLMNHIEEEIEKSVIKGASALLVSTKNIVVELQYKKEYVVLHGNYERRVSEKFQTNKNITYVVFAGGIETIRNTAFNVCDCAKYLDEGIMLLLLGYGDVAAISKLENKISEINAKSKGTLIKYLGTRVGKEYDKTLEKCTIGINYQNMDEYYMKYAFPSKVLNYLNYGLLTVTTPLETIRCSAIDKIVYYPDGMVNTPEAYAKTINQLVREKINRRTEILNAMDELNSDFQIKLKQLLQL